MNDATLQRLADVCRVLDHIEQRGHFGSAAHVRLMAERDRALIDIATPEPDVRHVPAFSDKRGKTR